MSSKVIYAPAAKKYESHNPNIDGHLTVSRTGKGCTPYTYLVGWSTRNKFYYGVRFKSGCHPSDFWVKYKTSSKQVTREIALFGEPDILMIRKVFTSPFKAYSLETRVLRKFDVRHNPSWLNGHDNIDFDQRFDSSSHKWMHIPETSEEMYIHESDVQSYLDKGVLLGRSPASFTKMSEILNKVDPTTGLKESERRAKIIAEKKLKHGTGKLGAIKAKEKLSIVGDDGLTGYQRAGLKISEGLLEIDELTGKTKAQLKGDQLSKSLSEIDPITGKTKADIRGDSRKKIYDDNPEKYKHILIKVEIYDSEDNLRFTVNGSFKRFCKEHNLPFQSLEKSIRNGERIYQSTHPTAIGRLTKTGMIKYKGWYAKKVDW